MNHNHTSSPGSSDHSVSDLLAELAGEASSKLRGIKSATQERQDRDQRLHAALSRIFQFFHPFSGHVNNIAPTIPRAYKLDDQTAYTSLKWQDAHTDSRKQNLSDVALLDHVSFHVRLLAPEPVLVTRRWNQLEALKKDLNSFNLRALDDLDMLLRNKSQQETFRARLAPDFFVKIKFQGSYDEGLIVMQCSNLDGFGPATYKLTPEQVSAQLLDDTGRLLIGRSDNLPLPLIHARCASKQYV